jgi:hypothetical protein
VQGDIGRSGACADARVTIFAAERRVRSGELLPASAAIDT